MIKRYLDNLEEHVSGKFKEFIKLYRILSVYQQENDEEAGSWKNNEGRARARA